MIFILYSSNCCYVIDGYFFPSGLPRTYGALTRPLYFSLNLTHVLLKRSPAIACLITITPLVSLFLSARKMLLPRFVSVGLTATASSRKVASNRNYAP